MTRPEWIEVGRISRAHGVHGEVRAVPDSDNPDRFASGSVFYGRPERQGRAGARRERSKLTVISVRGDASFPIVAFAEVTDRDGAEALRGYVLEIPGSDLPDLADGEFYPFDLIGLEVRDSEGVRWGRVVDALDTPAHALLAVVPIARESLGAGDDGEAGAPREVLVPFVEEAVPKVDVRGGYVVISARFLERT